MTYLVLSPGQQAIKILELVDLPMYYKYWILVLSAVNFIVFLLAEQYLFPTMATTISRLMYKKYQSGGERTQRWWHRMGIATRSKKRLRFKVILDEMEIQK